MLRMDLGMRLSGRGKAILVTHSLDDFGSQSCSPD